jgi:WD40 repeat protein
MNLSSASDDMTVKIWEVPDGGLTDKLSTPLQTLSGHGKPVTLLHFHPTANNVIASAAKDPSLKVCHSCGRP